MIKDHLFKYFCGCHAEFYMRLRLAETAKGGDVRKYYLASAQYDREEIERMIQEGSEDGQHLQRHGDTLPPREFL